MADKPITPEMGQNQSDSVAEALAVYSALARLAVREPEVGELPMMRDIRQAAYRTLLSASEAA